ncbi:MAG: CDP-alcohol phosphatidyltransferase family protein [Parcubacteria group bacterium]|nr:CDP-alcohol phosphatidyltransferase family protein [Parcubacteria group bacterium]
MNTLPKINIRDLRERLQKTAPEGARETFVARTIRFFSIYVTRLLIPTPITPNMITVIGVLVYLAGISMFVFSGLREQLIGVGLVYGSIILDACDGEVARWRKNTGFAGSAFVEPFSHDVQYAFLLAPLAIGVYIATQDIIIFAVGFVGTLAKLLTRFLQVRMDGLMSLQASESWATSAQSVPNKMSFSRWAYWIVNRNIFSSVGMVLPLLVFTLLGRIDIFVWMYAIGFLGILVLQSGRKVALINRMNKSI